MNLPFDVDVASNANNPCEYYVMLLLHNPSLGQTLFGNRQLKQPLRSSDKSKDGLLLSGIEVICTIYQR